MSLLHASRSAEHPIVHESSRDLPPRDLLHGVAHEILIPAIRRSAREVVHVVAVADGLW